MSRNALPLRSIPTALTLALLPWGPQALSVGGLPAGATALAAQETPLVVSTDWLAQNLRTPGLVILHVGNQSSFEEARIPGARLMPTQSFAPTVDGLSTEVPDPAAFREALEAAGISSDSRIVIYSATNPPQLAARLYITLDHFGLGAQSSLLDGGIMAWREEGRAVSSGAAEPVARGSLPQLRTSKGLFVDYEYVGARLADHAATVMDARDPQFWTGEERNPQNPRAGRIPGALNLPFRNMVDESGRFLPVAEIERLFQEAGVEPGARVITYCHVGQQASLLFFGARLTGREARLYDGSFQEWSSHPELPVATGN